MDKKKDISGLIFSAFLVISYTICSYFFIGIIDNSTGMETPVKILLKALVFVVFGLILFYATRVGDGKQVRRFSLAALILLDLPALYIILAAAAQGLPFPLDLSAVPETVNIAAAALGYGIPYTFLSGYELDRPKADEAENTADEPETESPEESDEAEETDTTEETETSDKSDEPEITGEAESEDEPEEL